MSLAKTGRESYKTLPDSNILFICTFDPFGRGLSTYTFRECCVEDGGLTLQVGTTKILYNCTYEGEDIPENLNNLYKYISTGKATDELTQRIEDAVQDGRNREEWRSAYMKERALIMDLLEEAREETEAANKRADSEALRADSEARRADSEANRADSEANRADSEANRADSEANRADSEANRADSEAQRADKYRKQLIAAGIVPEEV